MSRDILWYLNQIPIMMVWIYYYYNILTMRRGFKDIFRVSIAVFVQTIYGMITADYFGNNNLLRLAVNSFILVFLIVLIAKTNVKKTIIYYSINMAINIVVEVLAMLCSVGVDVLMNTSSDSFSFNGIFYILNDVLCFLAYTIVIKFKDKHAITAQNNIFEIVLMMVINQFMWVYWISYFIVLRRYPNLVLTSIVIIIQLINYAIIFYLIKEYSRINSEQLKIELKKDNDARLKEFISILGDKQNALTKIYERIQGENIEEIQLNDMANELSSIKNHIYCDNSSINALLSYFYDECNKQQIKYTVSIRCSLNNGIDDFEFNTLLSNAIKNALESCVQFVDIDINCKNDVLVIKCQNDCSDKRKTTKIIHGNGIQIIKSILGRHEGSYNFAIDNNIATLVCILNAN